MLWNSRAGFLSELAPFKICESCLCVCILCASSDRWFHPPTQNWCQRGYSNVCHRWSYGYMATDRKEENWDLRRNSLFWSGDLYFIGELIRDAQSLWSVQSRLCPIKRQVRDETPSHHWTYTFVYYGFSGWGEKTKIVLKRLITRMWVGLVFHLQILLTSGCFLRHCPFQCLHCLDDTGLWTQ